jgi:hypothetical protein
MGHAFLRAIEFRRVPMVTRFTRWVLGITAASTLLVGGGAALAAHGPRDHRGHRAHTSDASLVQQCIAAKRAGSAAAGPLCAAANNAANPPLTAAQLAQLQTLSQQCQAEKAAGASDTSACAEANALVAGQS